MKIKIPTSPCDIVELYVAVATEMKVDASKVNFDCRKINIAPNIQDGFYEYYSTLAREKDPNMSENDIKTGITMLLAISGPKVDQTLKANEVEVFDGFIC